VREKELAKELAEDFSLERLKDFLFEKDFTVGGKEIFIDLRREDLKESRPFYKAVSIQRA
jgi:hypothetical protein